MEQRERRDTGPLLPASARMPPLKVEPRRARQLLLALPLVAAFVLLLYAGFKFEPYSEMYMSSKHGLAASAAAGNGKATATAVRNVTAVPPALQACTFDGSHLRQFDLSPKINYARRYIRILPRESRNESTEADEIGPDSMKEVPQTLHPAMQMVDTAAKGTTHLVSCDTNYLDLDARTAHGVPEGAPKPSEMMFGVSTDVPRLRDSIPAMATWLGNSGARLVALVASSPDVPLLLKELKAAGIAAHVAVNDEKHERRYFALVEAFEEHKRSDTRWVGFIDDDTSFIRGLAPLRSMLARYDDRKPQYIGGLSEDFFHVRWSGFIGFGGGGVFVSTPLLNKLHKVYPLCVNIGEGGDKFDMGATGGDARLAECIYRHTHARLSVEHGLHQTDLLHNADGLLESGQDIISFHHYKTWFRLDPVPLTKAGLVCDGACLLQRFRFQALEGQASSVLTHGRSIAEYGPGVNPDFTRMEKTWFDEWNVGFGASLGPLRPKLEPKEKTSLYLEGVYTTGGGSWGHRPKLQHHVYVQRSAPADRVVELIWHV